MTSTRQVNIEPGGARAEPDGSRWRATRPIAIFMLVAAMLLTGTAAPAGADQDTARIRLIDDGQTHTATVWFNRVHPYPQYCNHSVMSARVKIRYRVRADNKFRIKRITVKNYTYSGSTQLQIGRVSRTTGDYTDYPSPPQGYLDSEIVRRSGWEIFRYTEAFASQNYLRINLYDGSRFACTLSGVVWIRR